VKVKHAQADNGAEQLPVASRRPASKRIEISSMEAAGHAWVDRVLARAAGGGPVTEAAAKEGISCACL
jgi:hypothetical protein